MMKICTKCKEEKFITEFHRDKQGKDGRRNICKECDRAMHQKYVEKNRKRVAETRRIAYRRNPNRTKLLNVKYQKKHKGRFLVRRAKVRAKAKNIQFDLDTYVQEIQDRVDAGRCEMTGVPFNLDGGRTFDSPSLDRINSKKGYIYSNIRVISHLMNCALGFWGEETLKNIMRQWLKE